MNLLAARVVLRARGITDIFDLAVPYCMRGWRLMSTLAAVSLLPAFAALLWLRLGWGWRWESVWTAAVVIGGFLQAPFVLGAGELLFVAKSRPRLRTLGKHFASRMLPFLSAHLLSRALLAISVVGVLTWPFAGVATLFVHEAALLEGATGSAALGRSRRLVANQGKAAFGVWVGAGLLPVICAMMADVLGEALINDVLQIDVPWGGLFDNGGSVYALVGFLLSLPFSVAARFLKYVDIRTRKEGWDIQLKFMSVVNREAASQRRAS